MTERVGLVDGSVEASTRRFSVVLDDDAVVQLDDLVATTQTLPDGRLVTHYGIVVEGTSSIEGAELASDTGRIAWEKTMPGVTSRRVEVQILRTSPELWLAPSPGATVAVARGEHRERALFLDQMERAFGVGVDQSGQPVFADFAFMNGEKGGHVSISGISGVATKTTYALFLLYMLFETEQGRSMLGAEAANTKALVFNVKGEDLLHLDRANARSAAHPEARAQWEALGVGDPGRFEGVHLFAPRSPHSREGALAVDVHTREGRDVEPFAWSPEEFIRRGLLRFCLTDVDDARNQLSFVEQRVRVQLVRWAYPLENEPGAVVMCPPPAETSFNVDRLLRERRPSRLAQEGVAVRNFSDLVDFLTTKLAPEADLEDPAWSAGVQAGTRLAFVRRLYAESPRLGHLVALGCRPPELEKHVTVVDIHSLHEDAQRFVVGALLSEIFDAKQGQGREPLRFIVLDELNKYAPRQGTSPLKDLMIDISARGRSLGVLLIGAQQSIGNVAPEIFTNAALKVAGRLDAGEADQYRFLSAELRERAARFLPGTMVLDQPLIPAPIPLRFPFPGFATNVGEDAGLSPEAEAAAAEEVWERL
ncbi:MAG: ATP-binding protein [Candidatus Dormibacteraeota bacterium]|nr:ATP-binding protein [Candidatus Dormibacteraeota bacterium]